MRSVRLMRSKDRKRETAQTSGMVREEAFSDGAMWSGYVHTAAGMTSGWHHHADYDTVVYVISGAIRMESGEGGGEIVEAQSGDFLLIPKHTIHRESNPGKTEAQVVIVRVGNGPPVVNVEGPTRG